MMPHLEILAAKLLQLRMFGHLKIVADLMAGLCSDGWSRLSDEDKRNYLEYLESDFHVRGFGDSEVGSWPEYHAIVELISLEMKAVRKRL
ncbi:MAG: hypothetical protein ACO1RA_16770 [Planctomycetaceae bacterium]